MDIQKVGALCMFLLSGKRFPSDLSDIPKQSLNAACGVHLHGTLGA